MSIKGRTVYATFKEKYRKFIKLQIVNRKATIINFLLRQICNFDISTIYINLILNFYLHLQKKILKLFSAKTFSVFILTNFGAMKRSTNVCSFQNFAQIILVSLVNAPFIARFLALLPIFISKRMLVLTFFI